MDLQRVQPAELLRAAAAQLPDGAITLDATAAPESWRLDGRRFSYAVLANLMRNAVQSSPANMPAAARAFVENGRLVFTVRDFGDGLPLGQEARIFDPFFTTRTNGTGLGLALARRVAQLHGGKITATNAEGGGALFRVEIPASNS
jgi:signal transduction histidine kinase